MQSERTLTSTSQSTIERLERTISEKDEERNLIREQLNEVELELRKSLDENTQLLSQQSSQSDQQ